MKSGFSSRRCGRSPFTARAPVRLLREFLDSGCNNSASLLLLMVDEEEISDGTSKPKRATNAERNSPVGRVSRLARRVCWNWACTDGNRKIYLMANPQPPLIKRCRSLKHRNQKNSPLGFPSLKSWT